VAAALPAVNLLHAVAAPSPDSTASQKAQQNIGPVIPAQNPCMPMYQSTYPPWVYQGLPPKAEGETSRQTSARIAPLVRAKAYAETDPDRKKTWNDWADCYEYE